MTNEPVVSTKNEFICINCGHQADKLYHQYKGGIIKIPLCKCGKLVDKYVEYDLVIVSLDAILLKRQAFRHILLNSSIQFNWKFGLVLLLCEAFTKLLQKSSRDVEINMMPDYMIYSALEVDLYWNFLLALVELSSFLFGLLLLVWMWKIFVHKDGTWPSLCNCACGVMLSNFGKILVLPALLWGGRYSVIYVWLSNIFTMAANVQATRVLCPSLNMVVLTCAVLFGHGLAFTASSLLPTEFSVT